MVEEEVGGRVRSVVMVGLEVDGGVAVLVS